MHDNHHSPDVCSDSVLRRIEHDLRACFRAGKTLPDWIIEDLEAEFSAVPDSIVEHVDMLRAQAERGDKLVVDLCTYFNAGREASTLERVNCEDLLGSAAARLPQGWTAALDCEVDYVFADGKALARVLELVLDNAITHHEASRGAIYMRARAAVITVDDNGPGISAEHLERVFEPLTTLKSRDDREGSGLGLAIARQLVLAMGGTITAGPRPGERGTRITITLPG